MTAFTMALAAGYRVALYALVRTDASAGAASTRRSVVAGVLAACVLLIAMMRMSGTPDLAIVVVAALSGAGTGALLLWPYRARGGGPRHAVAPDAV